MGRARDLANILSSSGNVALDSEMGLSLITPTSIAVTSGSGSISTTGAVSFTSASAISLNGIFNSTYDNYQLIYKFTSTATGALRARVRATGTDVTGGNYSEMNVTTGTSTGPGRLGTLNGTEWNFMNLLTSNSLTLNLNFYDIAKAAPTSISGFGIQQSVVSNIIGADHSVSTAYDGFTIFATGGTITGTVRIYGYRN